MKYIFETRMEVRDYECDIEGIVNNANYLHYAEHTRHLFLRSLGVSFAALHEQGIDAVVHSMKLQYKVPLRCDDEFISRLNLKKDGLKYLFYQDIYRAYYRNKKGVWYFQTCSSCSSSSLHLPCAIWQLHGSTDKYQWRRQESIVICFRTQFSSSSR